MSNYVMVIQYDGGRYDGWQRMGNERSDNTVQGKIAEVLRRMTGSEPEINCGCRTEKGVHVLYPGVTGWAQVNGRDELEIPEKVEFDRQYTEKRSIFMDIKIVFMTFIKVFKSEGVVEGSR